ncbi:hypothetical protein [Conexibacter sp. DBS9H8]|uniref:hypothetical protein n=1 Tax=Conexibacter sp. DBS9H8 TaxID=2937801 RepID=UPI00200BBCE1|nr:hypothetical protein [Conexibacter sp. DBS9H8]
MAKRTKLGNASSVGGDLAEEASSLLKRLIDESQLREAVEKLIDEGQAAADRLPATGRKARKQAKRELKRMGRKASRKAAKQQRKLARKGAAVAAEGKVLAKQKKGSVKRILTLGGGAAVAALVVSESLRSKLLDALFGAEEEFQYTPPEPPAAAGAGTPPPAA